MDYLSNFKIFIDPECEKARTVTVVLSTLGIVLSSLSLSLLILTAILFKEWRQSYKNQLLIQFMLARFFYTTARYVMEIKGAFSMFNIGPIFSYVNVFIWLYTANVQVAWIYVFSRQMYKSLVKMFCAKKRNIWIVSSLSWLVPVPITLVLTVTFQINPTEVRVYEIYLILIKWPLIITIAVHLILTLKAILMTNKSKPENNPRIIAFMTVLIFTFCGQEFIVDLFLVFALRSFRSNDITRTLRTATLIYNIISLYYCALAITFWLFGNARTRALWRFEKTDMRPLTLSPQNSVELGSSDK